MANKRIQRKRVKGWKMPANTKYVGRPTKFGNPYYVKAVDVGGWVGHAVYTGDEMRSIVFESQQSAVEHAVGLYRDWAERQIAADPSWLATLRGHNLACFCREGEPCHGDILLALLAEQESSDELADPD